MLNVEIDADCPRNLKGESQSPRPHQADCSAQDVVSVTSWGFRQDPGTSWKCLYCVRKFTSQVCVLSEVDL